MIKQRDQPTVQLGVGRRSGVLDVMWVFQFRSKLTCSAGHQHKSWSIHFLYLPKFKSSCTRSQVPLGSSGGLLYIAFPIPAAQVERLTFIFLENQRKSAIRSHQSPSSSPKAQRRLRFSPSEVHKEKVSKGLCRRQTLWAARVLRSPAVLGPGRLGEHGNPFWLCIVRYHKRKSGSLQ